MTPFRFPKLFAGLALLGASLAAHAQLSIEITGTGSNQIPVAIAHFENEGSLPMAVTDVVRQDLDRSGQFRLVDIGATPLGANVTPDFGSLSGAGADAALVGSIVPAEPGRVEARFRLYDVARQNSLGGEALRMQPAQYRVTGHRIADFVYEKLTGIRGIFSTRIAYVVRSGPHHYELHISDADGMNAQTALASREPIISPTWSPDGTRIAYVSFEAKKPIVYVHTLGTGMRRVVANFRGSNSAPAWAPDGQRLAVTLTKDGQSQIYIINADGSGVHRLMSSPSIDTEPAWSADGAYIYFTSDRGGSPQLYRTSASGGGVQRITFEGNYNVTPRPSPDGKSLAFISRNSGRFQVALMDLATRQTQILTDSSRDESPSFAPNGRMILYATDIGGRGVLAAVSVDGRVKQRLSVQAADVREPAWGPFPR